MNTHEKDWKINKEVRYTDSRLDEQDRGITIKVARSSCARAPKDLWFFYRLCCPSACGLSLEGRVIRVSLVLPLENALRLYPF